MEGNARCGLGQNRRTAFEEICGVSCSDHQFCLPVWDVTATQIIDLRPRDGVYI